MKSTSLLSTAAYAYLATLASAVGPAIPENAERLPGKPDLMPNWRWLNPFSNPNNTRITISSASEASAPTRFLPVCSSERTFQATEYLLDDLQELPPHGLIPWVEALRKVFTNRPYPGSWDGVDPHGYDRNMLMMEYSEVPEGVKRWIEGQEWADSDSAKDVAKKDKTSGKGLFAVLAKANVDIGEKIVATATELKEESKPQTKEEWEEWRNGDKNRVVIFAPGAIYENAPLWVAEGSDCEGKFSSSFLSIILWRTAQLTINHRNPFRHHKVHRQASRRRRRRRLPCPQDHRRQGKWQEGDGVHHQGPGAQG